MRRYPLHEWDPKATAKIAAALPALFFAAGLPEPTDADVAEMLFALEPVIFTKRARNLRRLDVELDNILREGGEEE